MLPGEDARAGEIPLMRRGWEFEGRKTLRVCRPRPVSKSQGKFAMRLTDKNRQDLWKAATQALSQAYAPYSRLRVGASVLTANGHIYAGANVENASYGLSLCAERAAIAQAVAAEGPSMRLKAVAVASSQPGALTPCGACRQVILEFGSAALVLFPGEEGLLEVPITELLPHAFRLSKEALPGEK